ncbi:hypothetical protein MKW92_040861 [Papaver armeniacum]|nr:hypothetical protein MKW92_040861 [Papaver armeniacum]
MTAFFTDGALGERSVLQFDDENLSSPSVRSIDRTTDSLDALHPKAVILRSLKIVIFSNKLNILMPFGPLAILIHYLTGNHVRMGIFLSLVGITPLAERLGFATDWGSLNATFGNATELIISIYALKNGMMRSYNNHYWAQFLSNMLLVLGCAFLTAATVNSGLLLMSVMGILFPAALHATHTEAHDGKSELLSRFSSCVMLIAYGAYLVFQLFSHKRLYEICLLFSTCMSNVIRDVNSGEAGDDDDDEVPEISKWECIIWLAILTAWISVLSEYLVDAIEGASVAWKMPIAFISVILLPIVGNAAEHASAIIFAMKDKLDISLGVAIGSSTQIAMFAVNSICVIVGWIMGRPMDLNFQVFETATLFITVLVVAFLLQDGTSNYFKGLMLILCYFIVAASFYVHVDPSSIASAPPHMASTPPPPPPPPPPQLSHLLKIQKIEFKRSSKTFLEGKK